MKFSEIIDQASDLLRRKGRITYRTLRLEFGLDEDQLDVLKEELIEGQRVAVEDGGKVLVWVGGPPVGSAQLAVVSAQHPSSTQTSDLGLRTSDVPGFWTPPHLAERIRVEQAAREARGATEGERKTVTALFADITNSMGLIEDLDPEEARALIDPAIQLMMDAVHRYEGYVVQYTGDGIFALFGAPIAHEDHPQRALYAALRMQEEMKRYADHLRLEQGVPLQIRVGLNTGEVVMRAIRKDDLHADYTAIGHSTSLASRMESLATPGAIVVSEQTYKLTEGYFEFKALGAAKVKGVSEPVQIYEVVGVGPLRTRLQVAARRGLTRFVGRQSEMEQMRRAFAQARAGHGQIVGVMGEPGLGKSRLFHEFVGATHASPLRSQYDCLVLETFSVSHGKASPYLPVIELLKSYLQIQPQDDERSRRQKVIGRVLELDRSLEETLPYLFFLLGIEDPQASLQQMDPQIRQRRTFAALKRLFLRESVNQPLILIFEDLHWIDSETQGFLDMLSESVASAKLLLLVNYRPEYRPEWGQKTYYTQLRLVPLGKEEADELLTFLLGADGSLRPLKHLIVEKTDGTPFFMEEVVQTLAEEGVLVGERGNYRLEKVPTELHISPTVQGVLAARIDRLASQEKELLQQLSVIGREFPLGLAKQVVRQSEEELYRLLASLQSKEFLYEQPAFLEVEYIFKHALTQEVAYGTVLQERRKTLHEQTAQAIEELYSAALEDHYSELAHHYSRSRNIEKAVEYLQKAGQQAIQRSAYEEAITHLNAAVALNKTLPETAARIRQDLALHVALGAPVQAMRGFGSAEAGAAYTRARELCEQVEEKTELFPILVGLRLFSTVRGDLHAARQIGEQLVRLADRVQDSDLVIEACYALAVPLTWMGKFTQAREYIERGLAVSTSQLHGTHSLVYVGGQDSTVRGLAYAAWLLWFLGYPDQATSKTRDLLTLIQTLASPFNTASAMGACALLYQMRGDVAQSQEAAEVAFSVATEHGFSQMQVTAAVLQGCVLVQHGQRTEGLAQMRQALVNMESTGTVLWQSYFLALLGEALMESGQYADGLAVLAEALSVAERNEEWFYGAELYRLKGELTLKQSEVRGPRSEVTNPQPLIPNPQTEAEASFLKAIEIARRQQAKSLELRAVLSLSRLWQQQGKKAEARQLLAEIYGWFTEGFDTKDLQEAKALLEELS